jgi:hypothetical protein
MKGPEALYYNMPHSTKIFILQSQLLYGFYFLKKKTERKCHWNPAMAGGIRA